MKFITDSDTLTNEFVRLIKSYDHFECAVAWAGDIHSSKFTAIKALVKNRQKIVKMVVGLHFYQTSPKFIEYFIDDLHVKYIMQTDGTFHPKAYMFYNDSKEWSVVIGSANLTPSAFSDNREICVIISSDDCDTNEQFETIKKYIDDLWENKADVISAKELEQYKTLFHHGQKKQTGMKLPFKHSDEVISRLDTMDWDEYFAKVCFDRLLGSSIKMLDKAQTMFHSHKHFNDLNQVERQLIAGCLASAYEDSDDLNWKMFGSNGNGQFHHEILHGKSIGNAIDMIPLMGKGDVSYKLFNQYIKAFSQWNDPIASASRLLAIKRPDLFVCINGRNKKQMAEALNIPQSHFTIDNYWYIIKRLQRSVWYTDNSISSNQQKKSIKKYRMAMLDSLCYEKDEI